MMGVSLRGLVARRGGVGGTATIGRVMLAGSACAAGGWGSFSNNRLESAREAMPPVRALPEGAL